MFILIEFKIEFYTEWLLLPPSTSFYPMIINQRSSSRKVECLQHDDDKMFENVHATREMIFVIIFYLSDRVELIMFM